jgi:MoaA/NifB/PqqE/SkfB family radical SAM enzyme
VPPLELDTLIFFVTSRCNSRCRTCFYWEELNRRDDLTFGEIERLSTSMPRFNEIWLSGGEPTLREELVEILALYHRQNGIRSVNLPVNGLLPDKLVRVAESIFAACPGLKMNLNLALDGIGETHDALRGVPGNYARALESLERLQELRRREPRLRLHVNSVVCRENVGEMVPLGETIRERFDLDGHYFQVIRGEPMDPALLEVHKESLARLYEELQPLYRHYAEKLGRRKGFTAKAGYLGVLSLYHEIQAANLDRHHRWPMPCTAGQNIAVLDANGDIRSCELRERLGNVRDHGCDWRRFWDSRERQEELAGIRRDGCWCTHVCFIHASLKASGKARLYDVPRAYLRQASRGAHATASSGTVGDRPLARPSSPPARVGAPEVEADGS